MSHREDLGNFAQTIFSQKYAHTKADGRKETWAECAQRVADAVTRGRIPNRQTDRLAELIYHRKFLPGGRFLYAAGRPLPQISNCFLFFVEDSRESWADLCQRCCSALMTGGGVGVVYSQVRPRGSYVGGLGGEATGPIALMQMVNEIGRQVRQGGSRRSAIWAGLHWNHADVKDFIRAKDWPGWLANRKRLDFDTPAPLDMTNISVILDDEFFLAYHDPTHPEHDHATEVYWDTVRHMCSTGEPGFSIDAGIHAGEHGRNACTEVVTRDDNDVCTLASINFARVESLAELEEIVDLGTTFLLCGTAYGATPFEGIRKTREKNRRVGLGLMGLHEWLLVRGKPYGPDTELRQWLDVYAGAEEIGVRRATDMRLSRPIATRAIAPTGTIGILGETTTGIEPVFAPALKRRWLKDRTWHASYIVDATARRLIDEHGVDPSQIEDAYTLARDVRRRVDFQCWVQQFVDMSISSTINMPRWGSPENNPDTVPAFGAMLIKRLPRLRGITVYPDGARGGQPLAPVPYEEALQYLDQEIVEGGEVRSSSEEEYGHTEACPGGVCGT